MLKHIRLVRNQIAHDAHTYQVSDPEDLEFVRDFYDCIFSGQDPLTILRKTVDAETERNREQKKQRREQERIVVSSVHTSPGYLPPKKESNKWIGFFIGIGVIALVVILVTILVYLNH